MPRQSVLTLLQALALYAGVAASTQCPLGYAPVSNGTDAQSTTDSKAITWVDCPTDKSPRLQCGMLDVPIDYADLSLGTLQMPVVRVPANTSTPRNQSVIVNPGGPGGSGIESFAGGSGDNIQAHIGTDFDLISFDPRGVGLNAAYLCPDKTILDTAVNASDGDSADLGDFDTGLLPSINDSVIPESPAWFQQQFDKYEAAADFCADSTYILAGQLVGTAFVARDVDRLARSLGQDDLIRFYGFSYGTLLGATIGAMFPDRVERMVLDGNINPSDYYYGLGDEAVSDFDPALEYFFNACAESGPQHCDLAEEGVSGPQLLEQYWTFYNSVREGNTTTNDEDGDPVGYKPILDVMSKIAFEGKAYYEEGAKHLATVYGNRDNTTKSASAQKHKRDSPFNPTNALSSFYTGTALLDAVTCGDGVRLNATNGQDFKDYMSAFKTHSKYGFETILSLAYSCGPWNISAKERPQKPFINIATKKPILFVQGFYDPVTPSVSARNSSSGFVGSAIAFHNGTGVSLSALCTH
jgi:pimeloyl-ACP methyl ester carboxylesterase